MRSPFVYALSLILLLFLVGQDIVHAQYIKRARDIGEVSHPSRLLLSQEDSLSKSQDSVQVKQHSAHKATIYSAILPGLGQAYNEKYWKIPVIYGGFATLAYFINMNTQEYRKFRDAYNYVNSGDTTGTDNDYVFKYSVNSLLQGRDFYRRNMEFSYILSALLYILNIVDAAVDAHLWDFDVSDDLSMRVQPMIMPSSVRQGLSGGISLSFNFR